MSEKTFIYTVHNCSPIILRMQQSLDYMVSHDADDAAIDLLKEAMMYQRLKEEVAAYEAGKEDSKRDSPQKPNP